MPLMNIFEPLFLLLVLATLVTIVWAVALVVRGRSARAGRLLARWLACALVYFAVVIVVSAVKARFNLPVMKAIPVEVAGDLAVVPAYARVADRLLFDARAPREATRPGGLGKPFDWRLLQNLDPGLPFMLSGGLDAGNVAEALRVTRAPGVDVSSGVERAPGEKDTAKIRAFIRIAREAQARLDAQRVASPA